MRLEVVSIRWLPQKEYRWPGSQSLPRRVAFIIIVLTTDVRLSLAKQYA